MKRLYILIVLVLWGFAQFAEAQNMYRNYYSSIVLPPESAVSVVHRNGFVYFFQTNSSNISVTEIDPLSMLPTGTWTDYLFQSQLYDFYLNGGFETFNGDFVLFGYCICNNWNPVVVKISGNLSSCDIYRFDVDGEFTAGCSGNDFTLGEVYVLVSSHGELYEVEDLNPLSAYQIGLDMNTNPYDVYTDISWDSYNNKFIATGSTWNGTNSCLHPFVEVFDLSYPNVNPIANYIVDNQSYTHTNEHRALHTQLSSNELLLYQDLRHIDSQKVYDDIWFTRINNYYNNTATISESWFYRLPNTKLTAKDMIYNPKTNRINFLGVFNNCPNASNLTQILAQVNPYSLSSGIEIGQLGWAFYSGYCIDDQETCRIYHSGMDMSNLVWNYHNPCHSVLIAGTEGDGGVLSETYDVSLSNCDTALCHKDKEAFPVLKPYPIISSINSAPVYHINTTTQPEYISVSYLCDYPDACSHQYGGKSIKQNTGSQCTKAIISIEANSFFVCEGFDGIIQYSLYDVTGRELQCGSTQNQVRNVLNISGSVFILKAKDSAGNQVVKKIVRL